jgi:hypothetical protein
MQLMNSEFNNIQNEWFNSCAIVNSSKDAKNFTNPFKYKYETLSCYVCFHIYISKCNMQCLNNGFNKFKVSDLIHVKMLIIQEMWKNHKFIPI